MNTLGGLSAGPNAVEKFKELTGGLTDNIQRGLKSGTHHFVNFRYMVVKSISGATSVRMFTVNDNAVISTSGMSSFNRGQFEHENPALITRIGLLYGTGSGATDATAVDFDYIPAVVKNGKFEFRVGGKLQFPSENVCTLFDNENTNEEKGFFNVQFPLIVPSKTTMQFDISWAAAAASNSFLKLQLEGAMIMSK